MDSKRILYIDPFSGVSGDMLLGAFLDLGVPLGVISGAVEAVIPGEVELAAVPATRSGLGGTLCDVKIVGGPARRTLEEMLDLVKASSLTETVVTASCRVLGSLGEAERKAHGKPEGPFHLHELGGQDTIADIVGSFAALCHLEPDEVHCGPVNLGRGYVQTSHGLMPVPAPATARLVEGMTVVSEGPAAELTTPTGAAILREIVDCFGPMGPMAIIAVGSGAGSRDFEGFANLLRVFRATRLSEAVSGGAVMLECGVDDVSPEYLAPATKALHEAGALEVHLIPALTKKGRMGVLLRVLAPEELGASLRDAVLETTGSAGLRYWTVERSVLEREVVRVETPQGEVSIKRWQSPSGKWRFKPEFEDVYRLAQEAGIPVLRMRDEAVSAYLSEVGDGQEED